MCRTQNTNSNMAKTSDNRINFTKTTLAKLPLPEKARSYFYDTQVSGLGLMVFASGTKTFFLYKRIGQRVEKIKLGRYPDLSIENARNKAHEQLALIASGKNPATEKRKIGAEQTLEGLFSLFIELHATPHKKPSSLKADKDNFDRYFSLWKKRKLSNISHNDIITLHTSIGKEKGIYIANKVLALLHTMFNKAIQWGWEGNNPVTGIRKFKEKSRDRFLQPNELPYFFAALNAETNITAKDYIMLSLLTGARKSNMLAMQWNQIDVSQAKWRIPETKNGEPVTIALSGQAMDIINKRKAAMQSNESQRSDIWVFPSEASKSGHLEEPKKAWHRLLKRAEIYYFIDLIAEKEKWNQSAILQAKEQIEDNINASLERYKQTLSEAKITLPQTILQDIRIHDLRRSLGSWQAVTGASLPVIGKSLGHKSQQATAIYARLNLDPVRESVEKATEAMMMAGKTG